jgi:NhaA family Na+:H+ antiporter
VNMTALFREFFATEKASGVVLILCMIVSLACANSGISSAYLSLWQAPLFGTTLASWINDGLMTLFFLLVGLEIEREIYVGELSRPRQALLPVVAALGGMAVPALVHLLLNVGTPSQPGMGIPMATDIAFALGVLALLGSRVPPALKVFLTALAIIDDLGAIIIIAAFYTSGVSLTAIALGAIIIGVLILCNRLGVRSIAFYLVSGVLLWMAIHASGVHATITGVILAFLIPFGKGDEASPSARLQHRLHHVVAFGILPLFALANTAITLGAGWQLGVLSPNSMGIILGLAAGKPIGITLFTLGAVGLGLCTLPEQLTRARVAAVSILGGIGFTMSIFITLLAFHDAAMVEHSKIAIVIASLMAGVAGFVALRFTLGPGNADDPA